MTAPRLYTPFSGTAGGPGSGISLSSPPDGQVGFYIVNTDLVGGETPSVAPAFERPRDTYTQLWPTITPWESASFVLAVRGSVDLPTLTWTFGSTFNYTVAWVLIDDCSFILRSGNMNNAGEVNISPIAQAGCFYSVRGGIGIGDATELPPPPQLATVLEASVDPACAYNLALGVAAPFSAIYATASPGPPTTGIDAETFDISTWVTNTSFFRDVWGSTLSIYAPGRNPDATYGWHTGRIGWA